MVRVQRNLPWVSHPQVHVAEGDTMKKPPKGQLLIVYCLDARLRGHDNQ